MADEYGFAWLLPQTGTAHSAVSHCFPTWMTHHQGRGAGEPLSVNQMIDYMVSEFAVDEDQVFMTGLSAGCNLVNFMLATYPDVFAAGAPIAAYPYKCATDIDDIPYCAYGYVNYTPLVWGNLARSGYPGYSGSRPVVQVWHGSWDATINLANQYQQVKQWTNVHGIDANVDWYGSLLGYPHYLYKTWAGATRVETVTVTYMDHAIAVDPGASSWQCGATGTYAADFNICSAYWIGVFFGVVA